MSKKIISTDNAPKAIGPYSQAVVAGNFLFVSGQIALEPKTGELLQGNVKIQTKRVMENIKGIVEAAGVSLEDIVKCTIFLKNMDDFAEVNEIYGSYFQSAPPARATVAVATLPKNVDVEIDAIVYIEG